MVVMIAITVVATVATAGAAAAAMGSAGLSSFSMALGVQTLAHGSVMAAAAGGFVGSVAGQLAGKAMGVVDSFSLKNALASGLTAGATAGMGNILGAGQTFQGAQAAQEASKAGMLGRFATVAKDATVSSLNIYGKMALAASATAFNVAANKLAGNHQASFQWRNVVTSTATAGAMHGMGVTNTGLALERFAGNEALLGGTLHGIVGAAIGYGVNKGLYNQGSWNFRSVATDAFGNAIGNSIVSAMMPATPQQAEKKAEAAAEQAKRRGASPEQVEAIKLETYARERGAVVEPVTTTSDGRSTSVTLRGEEHTGFRLSNGKDTALIDYSAGLDAVSDFLGDSPARNLAMQYAASRLVAKQASDAAFARGVVRGEQAYQRGYQERMANSGRIDFDLSKALASDNAMWGRGRQNAANFNRVMNNPYVVGTIGALQTLEGAVLTATGAAMSATGWGALAGVPIAGFGADQMQAGLRTVYNRQYTDSLANQGLQAVGLSPTQAGIAEAVLGGVGAGASAMRGFGRLSTQGDFVYVAPDMLPFRSQRGVVVNGQFIRTVTPEMSARFNDFGGMGYLDPMTNTFKSAPIGTKLQVDHIFPTSEIVRLRGFDKLTKPQMESILQDTIGIGNLQPLPAGLNQSKGAKLNWSLFKTQEIDSTYNSNLVKLQKQLEDDIRRQIAIYQKFNK
jgi:hypothetical protein